MVDRHKANYEPTVQDTLGESLASGECNYRFSHKTSAASLTSSSPLEVTSGTVTPGESAVSGRGSSSHSHLSKYDGYVTLKYS